MNCFYIDDIDCCILYIYIYHFSLCIPCMYLHFYYILFMSFVFIMLKIITNVMFYIMNCNTFLLYLS